MSYPVDDLEKLLQQSSQVANYQQVPPQQQQQQTPSRSTATTSFGFQVPGGNASLTEKLVFLAENERNSPEILPYPTELLAQLQAELAQRRDEIEEMRKQSNQANGGAGKENEVMDALLGIGGGNENNNQQNNNNQKNPNSHIQISSSSTLPFRVEDLLNLEVTRIKYAIADLIRVRLQKIQFFRDTIVEQADQYRDVLSENEFTLAQELSNVFSNAMQQGGLGQLPLEYREEPSEATPTPSLNRYVLAIILEASDIRLGGDDRKFETGQSILCPYESIRRHLVDGRVRLM
jgi:hypothetical protein